MSVRLPIDETNIALAVDKDKKFRPFNASLSWLNTSNEHVMVWYQMESFPSFIKLWGHVNGTL